jgi:hypothetical protein
MRHNKVVFGMLIADVIVGLCAAIGYYYYRAKLRSTHGVNIAAPTLAATAEQPRTRNDSDKPRT